MIAMMFLIANSSFGGYQDAQVPVFTASSLAKFYGIDFGIDTGGEVSVARLRAKSPLKHKMPKLPLAKQLNDSEKVEKKFSEGLTRIVVDLTDGRSILIDQAGYWNLRDSKNVSLGEFAFRRIDSISLALTWREALQGRFD